MVASIGMGKYEYGFKMGECVENREGLKNNQRMDVPHGVNSITRVVLERCNKCRKEGCGKVVSREEPII